MLISTDEIEITADVVEIIQNPDYAQLVTTYKKYGQQEDLLVTKNPESNKYCLVNYQDSACLLVMKSLHFVKGDERFKEVSCQLKPWQE